MNKPSFKAHWPHIRFRTLAVILLVIFLFASVPNMVSSYVIYLLIIFCLWGVAASSLNWILGYGGQFSFCHASFYGIGAYAAAILTIAGMSFWLALPIAAVLAAVFSYLIAIPSLQWYNNPYFAMITLGFATIIRMIFANWVSLTGGINGLFPINRPDPILLPFGLAITFTSDTTYFYLAFALLLITLLFSNWFVKSPAGLALKSIRDDEEASECLGVNNRKFKMLAFTLGSIFVSLAGALFAHYQGVIDPNDFTYSQSFDMAIMVLFGGRGTLLGPLLGAAFVTFVLEYLRPFLYLRLVIYGIVFVSVLFFSPSGIVGILPRLRTLGRIVREKADKNSKTIKT